MISVGEKTHSRAIFNATGNNGPNRLPFDGERCFRRYLENRPWKIEYHNKNCENGILVSFDDLYHVPPTAMLRRTKNGLSKGLGNIEKE